MALINLLFSCLSGIALIDDKNAHRGNRRDTKRRQIRRISLNQVPNMYKIVDKFQAKQCYLQSILVFKFTQICKL